MMSSNVLWVLSALNTDLQTTEEIATKLNAKPIVVASRLRALKYAGEAIIIDCGGKILAGVYHYHQELRRLLINQIPRKMLKQIAR